MTNVKVLDFAMAVLVTVGASGASAQIVPYVGFFSAISPNGEGLSEAFIPPGTAGALGTAWIIAYNFNCLVTGIELQVDYPTQITWFADIGTQPVTIGNTLNGMAMGWALPQDGFQGVVICSVLFTWNATNCGGPNRDKAIQVIGHQFLGTPGTPKYTCFNQVLPNVAVGLTALICPTVPVEESTWGKVKSLYVD